MITATVKQMHPRCAIKIIVIIAVGLLIIVYHVKMEKHV